LKPTIPVKGYPIIVEIEDIIQEIVPAEIYDQMICGTYKIADDADKSIYGNLPEHLNPLNLQRNRPVILSNPPMHQQRALIK